MDTKGSVHSNWGFTNPEPGWYLMEFVGEFAEKSNENSGKTTLRVPLKVVDGDYAGSQQSIFITLNPSTEGEARANKSKVANILAATGLDEAFEKKFPGDISALDAKVLDALKMRIPAKSVMVRLDESKGKDGKTYVNIVEMAPAGFNPKDDSKSNSKKVTGGDNEDW